MRSVAQMVAVSTDHTERRTLEACYREHRTRVYQWCLRYGAGHTGFAEDATHDVFIRLMEALPKLSRHEDLGGWLYRVSAHVSIKRLQRERSLWGKVERWLESRDTEPAGPGPDVALEHYQLGQAALEALAELPARERVVICMKYLDGRSQRDIAAELGLSEGFVSKLSARALDRLRSRGWEDFDAAA